MVSSDSYLGGVLVGDDFSGGEEPPDWLVFIRATTDVEGQLTLNVAMRAQIAARATARANMTALDHGVVNGHSTVVGSIRMLFGPLVAIAATSHVTAGLREVVRPRAAVSGHVSVSGTLALLPSLPDGIVQGQASVSADLTDYPALPLGIITAPATVIADLVSAVDTGIELEAVLVRAAASVHAGLTVLRHRTLVMFVTAGRAVDNTYDVELEARLGTDAIPEPQPEDTRGQTVSYA